MSYSHAPAPRQAPAIRDRAELAEAARAAELTPPAERSHEQIMTLVAFHRPLLHAVAARIAGRNSDLFSEVVAEGAVGLIHAARLYDPGKGCRFSTYAVVSVRRWAWRHVFQRQGLISVPASPRGWAKGLTRAEAAERLSPISLTDLAGRRAAEDGDADVPADPDPSPLEEEESAALRNAALADALDRMAPRDAELLRLRFGIGGGEPMTLREIGRRFGFTRQRAEQIEKDALARLRGLLGDAAGVGT